MRYRKLKSGEIVQEGDEYLSCFSREPKFIPVAKHTIGQKLLECNVPYYRRPIEEGE